MMNILIIEDEEAASKRLKKMLLKIDPLIRVVDIIDSVEDAITWFKKNDEPDLVMIDIQLSDGRCFEIFKKTDVECPIIFTTAYDEYAVEAFKVNSIDYLLKPIDQKALEKSINKYHALRKKFGQEDKTKLDAIIERLAIDKPSFKSRFLVKSGQSFQAVSTSEIMYFFIENQLVFMATSGIKKYIIDNSLDELESMIDPDMFFRINRQMIVSLDAIKAIHQYFNSRLKLDLSPEFNEDVLVSRNKVQGFKKWLDR